MSNLRTLAVHRMERNGMLYTLTVEAPFIHPHKTLPKKDIFIRQFADIVNNHGEHIEVSDVLRTAQEQIEEYLRESEDEKPTF